jgi:hypothetical protein
MSNVVAFEPYRLRHRRRKVAAACRHAVLRGGVLIVQDRTGRTLTFYGRFAFFEDCLEVVRDGWVTRVGYDDIKKVRVPAPDHSSDRPHSG